MVTWGVWGLGGVGTAGPGSNPNSSPGLAMGGGWPPVRTPQWGLERPPLAPLPWVGWGPQKCLRGKKRVGKVLGTTEVSHPSTYLFQGFSGDPSPKPPFLGGFGFQPANRA